MEIDNSKYYLEKLEEIHGERFIKSAITRHKSTGEWSLALLQSALHWGYDPRKYKKMDK